MYRVVLPVLLASALLQACAVAPTSSMTRPAAFSSSVPEGAVIAAPRGFLSMCERSPALCDDASKNLLETVSAADSKDMRSTLQLVEKVNRQVNRRVRPEEEILGSKGDNWERPVGGAGDCEDFAIEKRELLRDRGFPMKDTFFAVVYDREIGLHTVLVVRIDNEDYVLDNLSPWVLPWKKVSYTWVKRQSSLNKSLWTVASGLAGEADASSSIRFSTDLLLAQTDTAALGSTYAESIDSVSR